MVQIFRVLAQQLKAAQASSSGQRLDHRPEDLRLQHFLQLLSLIFTGTCTIRIYASMCIHTSMSVYLISDLISPVHRVKPSVGLQCWSTFLPSDLSSNGFMRTSDSANMNRIPRRQRICLWAIYTQRRSLKFEGSGSKQQEDDHMT